MIKWISGKIEDIKFKIKDNKQARISSGLFPVVGDSMAADLLVELSDDLEMQTKIYTKMIRSGADRKYILRQIDNIEDALNNTKTLLRDYSGV